MSAIFHQNPVHDGPSYSFANAPKTQAPEGARQHRFDPYVAIHSEIFAISELCLDDFVP